MALDAAIQLDLFDIIARPALAPYSPLLISRPNFQPATTEQPPCLIACSGCWPPTLCLLSVSKLEDGELKGVMDLLRRGSSSSEMRMGSHLLSFGQSLANVLKDAILEAGNLSERIRGKSNYEFVVSDPEIIRVMCDGMKAYSTVFMREVVKVYDGFSSLGLIVDVGGCTGTTLAIIIAEYPHIKGINFDLPQVVQNAPSYNGVEHVGGDMFVEVPKGDAILLKCILHNWNDEKCIELLKNCYEALPDKGKLIVMDPILPTIPQTDIHTKYTSGMDIIQLMTLDGKERTKDEFEALGTKARFTEFKVVGYVYGIWIMEFVKSV
ncbi:UNVERIFIED_CONTAM: Caffeic acid 3-O-methyltransferase [Sesamum calycinum]|uniref:Caffeic acid 3-O-methyltransferase n=1 Tax=Sesamum calycinum TaxID=2727403 RepID=A0AAW2P9U0_9LAMI